jgi:hypothetical protein
MPSALAVSTWSARRGVRIAPDPHPPDAQQGSKSAKTQPMMARAYMGGVNTGE